MTIQDAIRSGKPFRRSCWTNRAYWIEVSDSGNFVEADDRISDKIRIAAIIHPHEVLADDWTVRE